MKAKTPVKVDSGDSAVETAPIRIFRTSGKPIPDYYTPCGANGKTGPCQAPAMKNGRCRIHGGASLSGPALPQYIDGRSTPLRHEADMPRRLLDRFRASARDTNLLAMNAEIGVLDARLGDLLRGVESGDAAGLWIQLRKTWSEALKAQRAGDQANASLLLNEVDDLIRRGAADYMAWNEIRDVIQERRRLAESERQRLKDAQQTLTLTEAMSLIAALQESITKNVTDESALAAIRQDIIRVANYQVR